MNAKKFAIASIALGFLLAGCAATGSVTEDDTDTSLDGEVMEFSSESSVADVVDGEESPSSSSSSDAEVEADAAVEVEAGATN